MSFLSNTTLISVNPFIKKCFKLSFVFSGYNAINGVPWSPSKSVTGCLKTIQINLKVFLQEQKLHSNSENMGCTSPYHKPMHMHSLSRQAQLYTVCASWARGYKEFLCST